MTQQARESGIDIVGPVPWGTHFCQFYHTREDLLDILVPYFQAGLQNNESCLWITSELLPAVEVKDLLARTLPGLEDHLARGRLAIVDMGDGYLGDSFTADDVLADWLERERRALEQGFAGLRLSGSPFCLERPLRASFMDDEQKVNRILTRHRVLALCTCCLETCTARDALDVVRTHQFAFTRSPDGWEMIESAPLKVAREEFQQLNEQLEDRVRERTTELEAALRGRDAFLALLAHELRNPMAPILNGAHVLQLAGDDRSAREQALEMMLRQVRHLGQVVDNLLDISQITRGKVLLRRERLDLVRLVRAGIEGRRLALQQAGLHLVVDLPETPVWLSGDAIRLGQVLDNLLDNAGRFTETGGRVTVRLATDDGMVSLVVSDTGIGISPEVLSRLFQVFGQAGQRLERSRSGLGLGLALVKGMVELHGGTVEAASDGPGHGARFTVRLPLEPEPAALSELPEGARPAGRRLRVLVIEDNRDAAHSLRLLLGLHGHEVRLAFSGPEGIEAATCWRPDVIVSDIGLPGADGYEVARQLRESVGTRRSLLIALTGYGTDADRRQSRSAGFDHHLTKPADPEALAQILAGWVTMP